MSSTYIAPNANEAWDMEAQNLLSMGNPVVTRNANGISKTWEVLHSPIYVDMDSPVLTHPGRGASLKFMEAEAAWMLMGRNDTQYFKDKGLVKVCEFSDSGYAFRGSYGPKIYEQLPYVLDCLQDPQANSRQAVISIWRERPSKSKDIPCTLSMQFIVRDGLLHTSVAMRSSDIWLGVPYDIFNFSVISLYIARALNLDGLGTLCRFAGSSHLYDGMRSKCLEATQNSEPAPSNAVPFSNVPFQTHSQIVEALDAGEFIKALELG